MPWGDYGSVLLSGMTMHLEREKGLLQLERTGPFVPPISFPAPGHVVVTDDFRQRLEGSGLSGVSFRPVIKKRIVHLEWERWDRSTADPPVFPRSGEPEDYILERRHSRRLAKAIGDLWEVCLEQKVLAELVRSNAAPWSTEVHLLLASWDGTDFFRAKGVLYDYVSGRAKRWLEETTPEWVAFEAALVK